MTGLTLDIRGVSTVIRVAGSDTNGTYAVVEQQHPDRRGAPEHYHRFATETLIVLEGEYVILVDGELRRLKTGESVTVAPGVPHAFANKSGGPGRLLIVASPGGIENYFVAMSELDWEASDLTEQLIGLEERFGIVTVPK